jgi:phage terminase large subunit
MQVPLNFHPRKYQAEALAALDNGAVMNLWCWARRGGKDFTAFGYAVKKMVEYPINVVLVFPTKEQGKNAFWDNIENDGFKTIDHIPASLVARCDNSNMRITLKNGSTFQILGATDPDALRGANAKLYIFSEFVDIPAAALRVIRPIIANNGGQIIIQSTPKIDGISGGTFKILFDRAKVTPGQYASRITAHEYLTAEALEDLRQEAIAENGNDFFYRQEYLCDWGQASSTAYYAHILQGLRKRRGIGHYPYINGHRVYTAWDLGTSDSTAIVFFQIINKKVRIIDYFETHDIGYKPIVEHIKSLPYVYGWHFIPHDGAVRDQSDAIERIEKLREYGLINCSLLRREPVEDGINRVAESLPNIEINEHTTIELRRKLMLYKRKFNGLTGDYLGPEHKTESHAADSTRYVFAAIHQEFDKQTGEFMYSPEMAQETYETDTLSVAGGYAPGY